MSGRAPVEQNNWIFKGECGGPGRGVAFETGATPIANAEERGRWPESIVERIGNNKRSSAVTTFKRQALLAAAARWM